MPTSSVSSPLAALCSTNGSWQSTSRQRAACCPMSCDRTYENQQHRASGLNLLVTAIILWNTRYLKRAVAALRQTEDVPDQLLAHLSPLGWEHVNLTGDYIWSAERPVTESRDGFHPLRAGPDAARKAA